MFENDPYFSPSASRRKNGRLLLWVAGAFIGLGLVLAAVIMG